MGTVCTKAWTTLFITVETMPYIHIFSNDSSQPQTCCSSTSPVAPYSRSLWLKLQGAYWSMSCKMIAIPHKKDPEMGQQWSFSHTLDAISPLWSYGQQEQRLPRYQPILDEPTGPHSARSIHELKKPAARSKYLISHGHTKGQSFFVVLSFVVWSALSGAQRPIPASAHNPQDQWNSFHSITLIV